MVRSPDVVAGRVPTFLRDRPVTRAAFAFAARVHSADRRDADGAPFILHPLEVAALLSSCGCRDEVTAAAMLHDTLEDTVATGQQIEAEFGSEVAHLVRRLTEDGRIEDHRERKSALRGQVADCDCDCEARRPRSTPPTSCPRSASCGSACAPSRRSRSSPSDGPSSTTTG
ncbi:MAG: hypothetical protein QOH83_1013, partial [Solirubrobacteraceae bacterium]|nr:hypothetical protein [Solirubrobacteraceae bacterium]